MNVDLVTIWNGTLERDWIRAQQRPPDPVQPKPVSPTEDVLAYLARHPLSTMREIADGTGRDLSQVNAALYALLPKGRVERCAWRGEVGPSASGRPPVRWSAVR